MATMAVSEAFAFAEKRGLLNDSYKIHQLKCKYGYASHIPVAAKIRIEQLVVCELVRQYKANKFASFQKKLQAALTAYKTEASNTKVMPSIEKKSVTWGENVMHSWMTADDVDEDFSDDEE